MESLSVLVQDLTLADIASAAPGQANGTAQIQDDLEVLDAAMAAKWVAVKLSSGQASCSVTGQTHRP